MLVVSHVFGSDHLLCSYPHRDTELRECFRCFDPVLEGQQLKASCFRDQVALETSLARYTRCEFDHDAFVDCPEGIDHWVVLYEELPERLTEGYYYVERKHRRTIDAGQGSDKQTGVERLVMNFDPDDMPRHSGRQQSTPADSIS